MFWLSPIWKETFNRFFHWIVLRGRIVTISLVFQNVSYPTTFSFIFGLFTTKNVKHNPSSNQCRDSNSRPLDCQSPPITTRLGLPSKSFFIFLKKCTILGLFYHLFLVFSNKLYNFLLQYMWKNDHPVSGARIRTLNLLHVSVLLKPLDQGISLFATSFNLIETDLGGN